MTKFFEYMRELVFLTYLYINNRKQVKKVHNLKNWSGASQKEPIILILACSTPILQIIDFFGLFSVIYVWISKKN